MIDAKKSLDDIKSEVCDTTLVVMSWLILPALLISVSRAFEVGWRLQYSAQFVGALIVWGMTYFRHRLPYGLRANIILALLVWLGWSGQIFTPAPTSFVFFVSASVMAAVFYGATAGVVAMALSVLITVSTYLAIKAGIFPVPNTTTGMALGTWAARAVSLVIASAGPVIAVAQFRKSLMRELARSEAASDAKSVFLATMSHELRTPMTAIIGTAELLQQDVTVPDHARKVDRITRAGKNLLSLLNDLLDFAKIEAEQMSIDKVPFSVAELLDEVRDLFAPLAEEKGLTIRVVSTGAHDALVGDPARLRQIVSNLVGNAVKFTPRGEILIAVSQEERGQGQVLLRVGVTDTGIGITPEDQARLFQPFVQAQHVRSRTHGGTGLGLAISRKLAALMGGELSLVSEVGKGSTFTIALTLGIAPAFTLARPEVREAASASRRSLRVLMAEDNESIRDLMREMIARRGHAIDCVENGLEALNAVIARDYDVVVMDMHMPVMDGADATLGIRALDEPKASIPIIALTAGLTEDQRRSYLEAGVNQVVAKPAHWPTLFDAIESRAVGPAPPEKSTAQAAAPASAAPVCLDEALLAELESALGEAVMRDALVTFRTGIGEYDEQLQAALAAQDLSAARRLGHALKGASRQFGAVEVARLGATIEAKETTLEDMKKAAAHLPAAVARFDAALAHRMSD